MEKTEPIPEGYNLLLVDMRKAMWLSVWLLLDSLFVGILLMLLVQGESAFSGFVTKDPPQLLLDFLYLSALIFLGIFVHELIHGLTWMILGRKSWNRISYGVCWKYLSPYCYCKDALDCRTYRIGAMAPLFLLGLLPLLASIVIGDFFLLVLGSVFVSAAAGDVSIAWMLRNVPCDHLVLDHPTLPGCLVKDQEKAS